MDTAPVGVGNYQYRIYSEAIGAGGGVEMYDILNGNETAARRIMASISQDRLADEVKGVVSNAPKMLGFASEKYQISSNSKDYILVPVVIMPSDIPNRNGVGFPFETLTDFNPDAGVVAYQTWRGKPTHIDHKNNDITKAKGINFDVAFRPMRNTSGNLWKVITLSAFDRNKDPMLCNQILSGERNSYSMGAFAGGYDCSCCGARVEQGGCEHVKLGDPNFKVFDGVLAYLRVRDMMGFEVSSVTFPAYVSATNPTYFRLDES